MLAVMPGKRVMGFDEMAQPLAADMGIDLSCRDIGMPEHLLHRDEIGTGIDEMRGKSVPQHMRVDELGIEPRPARQRLQFEREMLPRQVPGAPMRGKMRSSDWSDALPARSLSQSWSALRARGEIGTIRSRPPLPRTTRRSRSFSTALVFSPTSSDTRKPVA